MKNSINIGMSGRNSVNIDLDILIRTRLLIQANSGGGKSFLLRRIAERSFGKIQTIIVDPEGEFASLREKYGYVLVGKGGETPADVRSAALVAHKLLELNASAVCDLYEMKSSQRHAWVRAFLEAIVDAPKTLWHPVLIIVDEAHNFAPEKGFGESEASDAMIDLATKGRKRGFCAIFATQRLGKLRKDAAAELTNVLIGQTFIDIDRKRAAECLGIPHSDQRKFFDEMKVVDPGNFWALGRAISKERILTQVGGVTTTHPEPGSSKQSSEPPPAPAKIKSLLAKLADLPKEAEQKARTEAELRAEVVNLKRALAAKPVPVEQVTATKIVEVPVFGKSEMRDVREALKSMEKILDRILAVDKTWDQHVNLINDKFQNTKFSLNKLSELVAHAAGVNSSPTAVPLVPLMRPSPWREGPAVKHAVKSIPDSVLSPVAKTIYDQASREDNNGLSAYALGLIKTMARRHPMQVTRGQLAVLSGRSIRSSAFSGAFVEIQRAGMVRHNGSLYLLTDLGLEAGGAADHSPQSPREKQDTWKQALPTYERSLFEVLLSVYPEGLTREELAARAGKSIKSSAFSGAVVSLRKNGLSDDIGGKIKASEILF